ncbi:unnamed protein product [Soboliphyme baturini]|uniref:Transformation/transcription domain-associated protein n=1 Tax=Soboliphyme baturini TaxID=241478 RepID=A0A183IVW4_9BILA|nr:unnamed protein product [Soboliphyme baturini]
MILTKLENLAKQEYQKKQTGFFGFLKDTLPVKTEADYERSYLKATLMLCYGFVVIHCPVNLLVIKLENVIMRFLSPYFENPMDDIIRQSLLETMRNIAISVHPTRIRYDFPFRPQMLHYIMVKI